MATTELLTDPSHTRADLATVRRAIREGWDIPEQLLSALPKIAGAMAVKGKPRDQIAAMKVLLAMKEQNDRPEPYTSPQTQTTINVGVNVANIADAGRDPLLAIAERIAAGGVSSANSIAPITISNSATEGLTTAASKRISSAGKRAPRKSTRNRRDTTGK
jgi:hypothetical protein